MALQWTGLTYTRLIGAEAQNFNSVVFTFDGRADCQQR